MKSLRLLSAVVVISIMAGCGGGPSRNSNTGMTADEKAAFADKKRMMDGEEKAELTREIIKNIALAVGVFYFDHQKYPDSLADLGKRPSYVDASLWRQAYYTGTLKDAWDHDLVYSVEDPEDGPWSVVSLGEDGKSGGDGFSADISNKD